MTDTTVLAAIQAQLAPTDIEFGFAASHVQTGARIALNDVALFPTASVFKVPVMVEIYRQAEQGRFSLSDRMPMPEAQRTVGSGVMQKLAPGADLTIRDLVMLMTIISDNTATSMLLDLAGPANVTRTMRDLGLENIHVTLTLPQLFLHAYGLPLDPPAGYAAMREAGNTRNMDYASLAFAATPENTTASAADMVSLMEKLARREVVSHAASEDMLAILRAQQLRDRVPRYLPNGAVGNKTGTFKGVRNDSGLIFRSERDIIAFSVFTFDRTDLPAGNSRALVERNILINNALAEIGQILWDRFAVD